MKTPPKPHRRAYAIQPAQRFSLPEQVARGLVQFIESEPILPGETLPSEHTLAARFEVSRPVVREAMKSLVATGIVRVVNGKGAVVQPLSADPLRIFFERAIGIDASAVREVMELRKGIEVQSAMLAAERRTDEDMDRLREAVERMGPNLHDPERYSELDLAFHVQIAAATHNAVLYHLVYSIRETILESMIEGFRRRQAELLVRTQELHEELLAAIEGQDVDGAGRVMVAHFAIPIAELEEEARTRTVRRRRR